MPSNHPAHAQSIIRAFALHSYILLANSPCPEQTAHADLSLSCPHMPVDTFSHGVAHITAVFTFSTWTDRAE